VSAESAFQPLSGCPQDQHLRWQRRGPNVRRAAEVPSPRALAVFSDFEPPRGLETRGGAPASGKAGLRDRPYRRSDLPAWDSAYAPQMGGVKQVPRAQGQRRHLAPTGLDRTAFTGRETGLEPPSDSGEGTDVGRAAETPTPRAVAHFFFEPSRALRPYLFWCPSLKASPCPIEESPCSRKAERFDRLRGRSDQARIRTRLRPSDAGVKRFRRALGRC
jgi:hypothetical protein